MDKVLNFQESQQAKKLSEISANFKLSTLEKVKQAIDLGVSLDWMFGLIANEIDQIKAVK